ncbi:Ribosomal rna small subunit methyltransferase f [Thalictrum thalictroides]|uniref:Ribosomal rna small subunit methyltransferase f n=1 Tax=Thalictrum thalictroides TaxID=46969 RepID=A0A7J6WV54_THATH|nr:Ribosomal rna small subunit methyltransferase f [Thalictrum thalictroides]
MGGGRGGQKRGRTQRKHFKQNKENVWKKNKSSSVGTDGTTNNNNNPNSWEDFVTQNVAFEDYYKGQEIVSVEEWEKFLSVLHKPLPAAFRINSSGQFFEDIRSQLENDFMKNLEMEVSDNGEVNAIRPLPWYPHNLAWHSNYSRMQLRKNQTLAKFHEFLKQANEIGNITRQEAVSMVPPLFLDVRPEHFILDMCAAPGSKTFQLLEIIHQSTETGLLPAGMVVANDVDVQRCNLLIHQTKRMCSANLIVTNHEAQHFPSCVNKSILDNVKTGSGEDLGMSQLLFDRVLCDVPCSGDGTLRKAPDIWRKWNIGLGNGVHRLQVEIAMRGIALLKVGGRMVYSTCSMNPVENEAVVAEILRRCGESVELLDVSTELPQLVRRPGLKKWKVRDRGIWLASYKDLPKYRRFAIFPSMFPSGRTCELEMTETDNPQEDLGPSGNASEVEIQTGLENRLENDTIIDSEESENLAISDSAVDAEVSCLPLERCMRIVPHDQNTGAFFIAVIQKVSSLPAGFNKNSNQNGHSTYSDNKTKKDLSENIVKDTSGLETNFSVDSNHQQSVLNEGDLDTESLDKQSVLDEGGLIEEDREAEGAELHEVEDNGHEKKREGNRRLQSQGKWRGVDPVVIFQDEATINGIREFYGINESFPFYDHLVTRNSDVERVKRIYYISKSVQDVLKLNIQVGQRLKITSVGLKIFERQTSKEGSSSPCLYRISSEGLPLLLPYITKQILCASLADFRHLLQYKSIKFADFVDAKFGEDASNLMLGCCVIVLAKGSQAARDPIEVDASTIAIGCWKGKTNISVMVSSIDCEELLERLSVRLGNTKDSSIQEVKPSDVDTEAKETSTDDAGN